MDRGGRRKDGLYHPWQPVGNRLKRAPALRCLMQIVYSLNEARIVIESRQLHCRIHSHMDRRAISRLRDLHRRHLPSQKNQS